MSASEAHPVLAGLPLLALLPSALRGVVVDSFVPVSFPFGAVVVREGDEAQALFVVASGRARVLKLGDDGQEIPLGVLGPGDAFGEAALLDRTARRATVRASSQLEALRLDRSLVDALVARYPELRQAMAREARLRQMANFFRVSSVFADLPQAALAVMVDDLDVVEVEAGAVVIDQGEEAGPMYVVEEGRLRATRKVDGRHQDVAFLRRGDVFGEASLLRGSRREATVAALTPARLLRLRQETFHQLLGEHPEFRARVEQQAAGYRPATAARVPLDFAEEVLPADPGGDGAAPAEQAGQPRPTPAAEGEPDPAAGPDEPPAKAGRRRIRRFRHLWQLDEMDCGAACLAMVTRHFGRDVSIGHVRQAVGTTVDGTSLLGITRGARALGMEARSVKVSKSRLDELPMPAIVHWSGNHWVVLYDVGRRRVRIADPARGLRRIPRETFASTWSGYAAVLAPTPELASAPVQGSKFGWIFGFLRPYRRTIALAVLLAAAAAALAMVLPVIAGVIVDEVVTDHDLGLLRLLLGAMVLVLVLMVAASVGQRYLLSRAAVRIDGSALDFISGRLLALPLSYFHTRRTGDISRRLAGVRQAREFLVQEGVTALSAAAQILAALAFMFAYSWTLALVFLAAAPVYAALVRFSVRYLRPMYDNLEDAFANYHSRQIDAIKGIETVKSLGAEPTLQARMLDQFTGVSQRLFRADLTVALYEGAVQAVAFASLILFLWAGAYQALDGRLTVGELVSFNALVLLAIAPVQLLLSMWDQFQFASVLLGRLNDVLEHEPEQGADHSRLRPVPTMSGAIRLTDVGFWYPGPSPVPILDGITMDVAPGTTVAIVGRSGSGKSTLVKLLAGLAEPARGTITYDGVDLATLEFRDLRRQIGFVLQETYLFDDTIARNIAFGADEVDMERVQWAARLANAHDFIDQLPLGYDTRVGETGVLLSGGQRQRVAIARALYHRPPVLVFDEATSALDTESERAVQDNIDQLVEGRTSFVIAHRLSTIRRADLIVVLEQGRVVEQGSHDELMNRRGLYAHLVSQQIG
jgi:ATP-binding cassette subfamily B protein